jgi:hypothetical protein
VALRKGSAAITLLNHSTNGRDWLQEGQTVNVNKSRDGSIQINSVPPAGILSLSENQPTKSNI